MTNATTLVTVTPQLLELGCASPGPCKSHPARVKRNHHQILEQTTKSSSAGQASLATQPSAPAVTAAVHTEGKNVDMYSVQAYMAHNTKGGA